MRVLIREVQKEDLSQLVELCALHAAHENCAYDSMGKEEMLLKHLFHESNDIQCIIVENQEKLLGYATFTRQFSTWDAAYYVYLDCIYLREEVRGKGIGRKLMQQVKAYAAKTESIHVQWHTPPFNKDAIQFYKRLGAISKSKERFFWH